MWHSRLRFVSRLAVCAASAAVLVPPSRASAQHSIAAGGDIDFTGFTGGGFTPNPGAGQLDSDTWSVTGLTDGPLAFGGTGTSGDYARGSSSGGVSTAGIYAFDVGGGNVTLGFQATTDDLTPGELILRVENDTGQNLSGLEISYSIWVLNNDGRSNDVRFGHSASGTGATVDA